MYGGIFLPPICKVNYVNMQPIYVDMRDNYADMQFKVSYLACRHKYVTH